MLLNQNLKTITDAVKSGPNTAQRIIAECLHEIDVNRNLGAFIHVNDRALKDAEKIDNRVSEGHQLGLLCGAPIAIKDLIETQNFPTTNGGIQETIRATHDALIVSRLLAADAILIGKTNLHEYAFGTTGINPHFGPARNPIDPLRMAGGSSSGSAVAVAAGMCASAVGTDTGGSIRIPCALTGLVGFKPTYGNIPTDGVFPLARSLDHVGPMTRSVDDAARLYSVLSGEEFEEARDPQRPEGLSIRVGVPSNFFWDMGDNNVFQTIEACLKRLSGANGAHITLHSIQIPCMNDVPSAQSVLLFSEAAAIHRTRYQESPEKFGQDIQARLAQSMEYRAYEYVLAKDLQQTFKAQVEQAFTEVDVFAMPTVPIQAPRLTDTAWSQGQVSQPIPAMLNRCTNPWNFSHCPAITIPCPVPSSHLPVGLQLVAPWNEDYKLLQIARIAEASLADIRA